MEYPVLLPGKGKGSPFSDQAQSTITNDQSSESSELKDADENGKQTQSDIEHGCFSSSVLYAQTKTSTYYQSYKTHLKWSCVVILTLLYFAYFSYCMYYEFGTKESLTLLYITCAVVLIGIFVKSSLWKRISKLLHRRCKKVSEKSKALISCVLGLMLLAAWLVFVLVDVVFIKKEPYNLVSLSGIVLYVFIVFVTSANPARVKWLTVLWGLNIQLLLAVFVLRWQAGYHIVQQISQVFVTYISFTDAGSHYVFGQNLMVHWFIFKAMPVVVFLSATISVLYHLGVMQRLILVIGWILQKIMGTTAAESMAAAGNIFVGNTEAPLLILPLVKKMTTSELHCMMVGGFATISGSAFGVFVLFGARPDYLVAASIMSAPAALALAKLSYPEVEVSKTTVADVKAINKSPYRNIIEAISSGAKTSIKLIANITVNIIAFVSMMAFLNHVLAWLGNRAGLNDPPLSFGLICSYALMPLALVMGVEIESCRKVAEVVGIKLFVDMTMAWKMIGQFSSNREVYDGHILNNGTYEHIGSDIILYHQAGGNTTLANGIISERSLAITSFAICGFSNVASIGIMMGALIGMIPERKSELSELVIRAILVGNITSFMTACFSGLLFKQGGVL